MGLISTLGIPLFFLSLYGICKGFVQDNCTKYPLQFERVFSVPGDVAMLNSTLVSPDVFNFTAVKYSITWYNSKTGQEMSNQTGRVLVYGETLWFLNATLDDNGEYVCLLRTPSHCYIQATKLVVELADVGECGRPRKAIQPLKYGVADNLMCPLRDYISKLDSYNIKYSLTWYRGCEPIPDGTSKYTYRDITKLMINSVEREDNHPYTCTLTFSLSGITGTVSETIEASVEEEYFMVPQVREPDGEIIKARKGYEFNKTCLVFIPGVGRPFVHVIWLVGSNIFDTNSSKRIYTSETQFRESQNGVFIEVLLKISEVREEDFNVSYTCRVYSDRGIPENYFILQPADPNILLLIGTVLGGVMVLFIICVSVYCIFRIAIYLRS